ncbi:MAG TPA: hypothetical protein DCL64_04765 [Ruminococcaceae bacterium]|nr:hypothetical protein [Oscillospiraceae bacterium]
MPAVRREAGGKTETQERRVCSMLFKKFFGGRKGETRMSGMDDSLFSAAFPGELTVALDVG